MHVLNHTRNHFGIQLLYTLYSDFLQSLEDSYTLHDDPTTMNIRF